MPVLHCHVANVLCGKRLFWLVNLAFTVLCKEELFFFEDLGKNLVDILIVWDRSLCCFL